MDDIARYTPEDEAQAAREAATGRMTRAVRPPEGRPSGALTEALMNLVIPGRNVLQSVNEGDYPGAAANAAMTIGGPLARGAGRAFGALPPAGRAALAGGAAGVAGTLWPSETESATKLTRAQQQQIEMDNQRRAGEAATQRQALEAQVAADRQRRMDEAEIESRRQATMAQQQLEAGENQRRANEEAAARQHEADIAEQTRVSRLPFRERHPALSTGIQAAGLAGAAGVPFLSALRRTGRLQGATDKLEQTMEAGNKFGSKMAADQLQQYYKPGVLSKLNTANSALMPFEGGTVIPNAWDFYSLRGDESNPAWQNARDQINPMGRQFWENLGTGLVEGAPAAAIGGKLADIARPAPAEKAAGLLKSYGERKQWPKQGNAAPKKAPQVSAVPEYTPQRKPPPPKKSNGANGGTPSYTPPE